MTLKRIISGGQTGADQAGLAAGVARGIETGGWAPKGWRTEDGPAPWLADLGLVECQDPVYAVRTRLNVRDSAGTVIFGDPNSRGSLCTLKAIKDYQRPFLINPDPLHLLNWIGLNRVEVLNVAGNRASVSPDIYDITFRTLVEALQ